MTETPRLTAERAMFLTSDVERLLLERDEARQQLAASQQEVERLKAELERERQAHQVCRHGQQTFLDALNHAVGRADRAEAKLAQVVEALKKLPYASRQDSVNRNWEWTALESDVQAILALAAPEEP